MIFTETKLKGVFTVDIERLEDERGFFGRTWCRREFEVHGLDPGLVQCSISFNLKAGTLRGMHYQAPPFEEDKLIRCTRGGVYDVIVDIRPDSPTFGQHESFLLTSENRRMLFVPKSFAHGFMTLEDETEVFYQMSEFYYPEHSRGFRWNDPRFNIDWPREINVISARDRNYPDFTQ
jgi:dTDP-4-dehydrorhamnose 3,5-epimerase